MMKNIGVEVAIDIDAMNTPRFGRFALERNAHVMVHRACPV